MKKNLIASLALLLGISTVQAQKYVTESVSLNPVIESTVQFEVDSQKSLVTMTMEGPADRWMAVGFDAPTMIAGTDCVYISNGVLVDGHITGFRPPAVDNSSDWNVLSNMVSQGKRTVVATRARDTGDANDYVFPLDEEPITLIYANGSNAGDVAMDYHGRGANRGATVSNLTLGVDDVARIDAQLVRIHPNPTAARINVELPDDFRNGQLNLYNLMGQKVAESELSEVSDSVDMSSFDTGVYLLEIVNEEGESVVKRITKS